MDALYQPVLLNAMSFFSCVKLLPRETFVLFLNISESRGNSTVSATS
jgi:hypothetical protein